MQDFCDFFTHFGALQKTILHISVKLYLHITQFTTRCKHFQARYHLRPHDVIILRVGILVSDWLHRKWSSAVGIPAVCCHGDYVHVLYVLLLFWKSSGKFHWHKNARHSIILLVFPRQCLKLSLFRFQIFFWILGFAHQHQLLPVVISWLGTLLVVDSPYHRWSL